MALNRIAKDPESGEKHCQSVYTADDGMCVVQGLTVDGATHGELSDVLDGESAVRIKPDVLLAAAQQLQQ